MNGRIYDPRLGRFLQADPMVQAPKNSQNLNRYSYVLNNPLSYTDPSGYFFSSLWKKWLRPLASIAITAWMPVLLPYTGALAAATTGFAAGLVATGSLKGALVGAFTGALFHGIGSHFEQFKDSGNWGELGLSGGKFAAKSFAHGMAGGIQSSLNGGKFGHGFFSAGVTQAFSGRIGKLDADNAGFSPQRVFAAAGVAGTISVLTGGKFANGAVTGAFSRSLNDELHPFIKKTLAALQVQKFWMQFGELTPEQLTAAFPNLVAGAADDFEIQFRQAAILEFYRSEAIEQLLDVAHSANDLLGDYYNSRVMGIVGARGRIVSILGKGAGLSEGQMRFLNDAFALKAFAQQQRVNISQLNDLSNTLIQNNQNLNQAISHLRDSDL